MAVAAANGEAHRLRPRAFGDSDRGLAQAVLGIIDSLVQRQAHGGRLDFAQAQVIYPHRAHAGQPHRKIVGLGWASRL